MRAVSGTSMASDGTSTSKGMAIPRSAALAATNLSATGVAASRAGAVNVANNGFSNQDAADQPGWEKKFVVDGTQ